MVGPWIHALFGRRKRLSDIEYLAVQEFNGNLTHGEGTLSVTGDLVKITAGSGDMYLAKAKVSMRNDDTNFSGGGIVELQAGVDGTETTIATWACELSTTSAGLIGSNTSTYEFVMSGIKVTTGQVIQLLVSTLDTKVEVNGELVCIEVATGVSPAV